MAIELYSKEECKYCNYSKELLDKHNIKYNEIKLNPKDENYIKIRDELIEKSKGHNTFPWIYIGDHFLGGFNELRHSISTGSIVKYLNKIGIEFKIDDDDF
jgi:thioredoxin reductase (NADPH)